jgi:hypothetical protein
LSWWEELSPKVRTDARRLVSMITSAGGSAVVTSVKRNGPAARRLERTYGVGCCKPQQHSKHEQGLAFDAHILPVALAAKAGRIWRSWGHRWVSADPVHFEA